MLKRVFFVGLLVAGNAIAQDVTVSGKELESGAADAKVAALAQQAAQAGKPVVVNAPSEWHAKIAAKLRAAGVTNVKLNDSFVESAVLRIEDKPATKAEPAPKPEPAPAPKPVEPVKPVEAAKPTPAPKPAAPPPAPKPVALPPPEAKPETKPEPKPEPAVEAPAPAPAEPAAPSIPVAEPTPAPVAPPPAPAPASAAPAAKAPVDATAAAHQRFERSLNEGRAADGSLKPEQLEKGDVIYVEGKVLAVVRRDRLNSKLYWLDGTLELQRVELNPLAENRYEVTDKLRSDVALRGGAGPVRVFQAKSPDDAERASLQKQYGEGRDITHSFRVDQLKTGDLVYFGKAAAVVVRRDGSTYVRGWLEGNIDLGQEGLQKDGNKYKVLSDKVH